MTHILLTRHGHVEGIDPPRFRGRREIPLSPLGRKQADAVASRIAEEWKIGAVYTSPLRRCLDTAAAIADAFGIRAAVLDTMLDLDYGDWEWKTYDEMGRRHPELFSRWFATPQLMRFPNGESLQDLVARAANVLRAVLARHDEGSVVLVGHASINRALLLQVLDQPLSAYWRLEQSPCALNEFAFSGDRVRLLRYNDTSHLRSASTAAAGSG